MGSKDRRQREIDDLRHRILRTAADLVAEVGHERLTIRMLAGRIEYSPRTIYLYFKDKDDLLRQIVEYGFSYTARRIPSADELETTSPRILMERIVRDHVAMALANPNFYRIMIYLVLEKRYPPGPNQEAVMRFAGAAIERCLSAGESLKTEFGRESAGPERQSGPYSFAIIAAMRGFTAALISITDGATEAERESMISAFLRLLFHGTEGLSGFRPTGDRAERT